MKNIYYLLIFVLLNGWFFSGCKTGEKRQFTDWSIPTVKLSPHSKDEKIVPPAEKASPQATASLAHDRLSGHNPTAAIRENSDDPTLRPNPQEVAQLNQFEGQQSPDWASSEALPPGPEATAPVASERIAQNVTEQTIAGTQATPATPGLEQAPSQILDAANQPIQTAQAAQAIPAAQAAQMAGGSVPIEASTGHYGNELPNSLETLPGSVSDSSSVPSTGTVQQAGAVMTELPETLPASAAVPGVQAQPGSSQSSTQAQPAVLFMPGNINPQYPQGPAGR